MRKLLFLLVLTVCAVFIQACVYDNEEELFLEGGCNSNDQSYNEDILPLIQANCYRCHDAARNFGGVNLEGHDQLQKFAESGDLLGAIRHDSGYSPMPKDAARLDDCIIERIEAWVNDGAPNN